MRKALSHSGALLATFVIGLSLIGAAYALWFEDLTLTATVTTGTFDVDWSLECVPSDGQVEPDCTGIAPVVVVNPGESQQVLVGDDIPDGKAPSCTADIDDGEEGSANDEGTNNALTLTMSGLYPYAGCDFSIDIHAVGSVPAHFTLISVTVTEDGGTPTVAPPWTLFNLGPDPGGFCAAYLDAIYPVPAIGELLVDGEDEVVQLHQNDKVVCHFRLLLDQSAEEGVEWVFTQVIKAHQWNETP